MKNEIELTKALDVIAELILKEMPVSKRPEKEALIKTITDIFDQELENSA